MIARYKSLFFLKFITGIVFCQCLSIKIYSQARVMLNNNPYIVFSGGTSLTPIYLVLDNSATNAITLLTAQVNGGIKSEAEFNMVKWNIGTAIGIYAVPFTKAAGGPILPLTVNITGAGTGAGNVKFSTYAGGSWDNNIYKPSDVTATLDLATGLSNNSAYVIDRFWEIDANGYTSNATRPAATITFTYADAEWSAVGNTITEVNLFAQRFNSALNKWADWLGPYGTANTVANTVSSGAVTGANLFRSWTLSDQVSPLPVELTGFNGQCYSGSVLLTWTTATETNNDYFTIERTFDGDTYETVGVVRGVGNSSTTHYYSYIDKKPFQGTAYYRIKQTDYNGATTTYGLIGVKSCSGISGDEIINAYHADGNTTVWINVDSDKEGILAVYDMLGKKITEESIKSFTQGFNEVRIPSSLVPGFYIITFTSGSHLLSRKLSLSW